EAAEYRQEELAEAALVTVEKISRGELVVETGVAKGSLSKETEQQLRKIAVQARWPVRRADRKAWSNRSDIIDAAPVKPEKVNEARRKLAELSMIWNKHPEVLTPFIVDLARKKERDPVELARCLKESCALPIAIGQVKDLSDKVTAMDREAGRKLLFKRMQ